MFSLPKEFLLVVWLTTINSCDWRLEKVFIWNHLLFTLYAGVTMESRSGYDMVPTQHSPSLGQTHVGLGSYGYRLPSSSTVGPDHNADNDSRKDIGDILQQIMTITDQSLDEAQARWVVHCKYLSLLLHLVTLRLQWSAWIYILEILANMAYDFWCVLVVLYWLVVMTVPRHV